MTLDVARLRSLIDTRETHAATLKAAIDAKADAQRRSEEARGRLMTVDSALDGLLPEALPHLIEAAELLAELLPCVDLGKVGHRQNDLHIPMGCDCARCRACELLGEAR